MGRGGGGGGGIVSYPCRPTAADGLHHRYVLNSAHSHQNFSGPRYEVIAYLSYSKELLVIAMAMEDDKSLPMCITAAAKMIGMSFFAAKMAEGLQVHAALHPVEVPIHQ